MITEQLTVRFYETDALGHVNNTVIPQWFEAGRIPLFDLFTEQSESGNVALIVANLNVDFVRPIYFGHPVTLKTFIRRLGTSSFDIGTEVWQSGHVCAKGTTIMVNYDYQAQRSVAMSDSIKTTLAEYAHPDYPLTTASGV